MKTATKKDQLKKMWNVYKTQIQSPYSISFKLCGVDVDLKYEIDIHDDHWEHSILDYTIKDKNVVKFMDKFDMCLTQDELPDHAWDMINENIDKLYSDWSILCSEVGQNPMQFFTRCRSFKQFWSEFQSPNVSYVPLSKHYTARIAKGKKTIVVGCQNIDIDVVRKVVSEWDNLNQK
jgi:hypothetical protein